MLGKLLQTGRDNWQATWIDTDGIKQTAGFRKHDQAVAHIVDHASRGLRFHDLRHSYATWLISTGVPVNDVQKVMGHERGSTTLNLYAHGSEDRNERVLKAFIGPC
jgi:integrase